MRWAAADGACREEVIYFAAAGTPLPSKDLVFVNGVGGVSFAFGGCTSDGKARAENTDIESA